MPLRYIADEVPVGFRGILMFAFDPKSTLAATGMKILVRLVHVL